MLEKVGFTEEGIHRREAFINGEFVDVHRYGLLVREWWGRKPSEQLRRLVT